MRILFFGVDVMGEACLSALLTAGHEVAGVVTLASPKRTLLQRLFGRRQPPGVAEIAQQRRLPVLTPETLRDPSLVRRLAALKPDLLVVATFDKVLPPEVLAIAPYGGINVHPSLLPRHRGPAPVSRAIWAGDEETGLTVHLLEETVDAGPILLQHRHPIRPGDNAQRLIRRLAKAAPAILLETLEGVQDGTLYPRPQPAESTPAPFFSLREGRLDWNADDEQILRTIRACSPYPGAFLTARGERLAVLEASAEEGRQGASPGTVLSVNASGILVQTREGAIRCRRLRRGDRLVPPNQLGKWAADGERLKSGNWASPAPRA
ncbi:MAG TPA: methionyl-tRNA formyltransferase [Pantanalinema sp.]